MNKKGLTETDIRTKFITPALVGPNGDKWNVMTQIAEQRRIVAKVDELMTLVDALETQLAKLLEALVATLTSQGTG